MCIGAPLGGRVHWFLYNLPDFIKRLYVVRYDYALHNYAMFRYKKRSLIDLFMIVRTSRRCWRCIYCHYLKKSVNYFSAQSSKQLIKQIQLIYEENK